MFVIIIALPWYLFLSSFFKDLFYNASRTEIEVVRYMRGRSKVAISKTHIPYGTPIASIREFKPVV
jgi:hypothetical protein